MKKSMFWIIFIWLCLIKVVYGVIGVGVGGLGLLMRFRSCCCFFFVVVVGFKLLFNFFKLVVIIFGVVKVWGGILFFGKFNLLLMVEFVFLGCWGGMFLLGSLKEVGEGWLGGSVWGSVWGIKVFVFLKVLVIVVVEIVCLKKFFGMGVEFCLVLFFGCKNIGGCSGVIDDVGVGRVGNGFCGVLEIEDFVGINFFLKFNFWVVVFNWLIFVVVLFVGFVLIWILNLGFVVLVVVLFLLLLLLLVVFKFFVNFFVVCVCKLIFEVGWFVVFNLGEGVCVEVVLIVVSFMFDIVGIGFVLLFEFVLYKWWCD